jgi:hypothetical protein
MQRTRKDRNECKEKMDTDRNNDFSECRLCKILNGGGTNSKEHHMSFIINLEKLNSGRFNKLIRRHLNGASTTPWPDDNPECHLSHRCELLSLQA